MKHKVAISIGSNVADGDAHVKQAIASLSEILSDSRDSGAYVTPALSGDGSTYVNAVMIGRYAGSIDLLKILCKTLEHTHGRDSQARREHRVPLDLDIVVFDNTVLRPKDYTAPYFTKGYIALCSDE